MPLVAGIGLLEVAGPFAGCKTIVGAGKNRSWLPFDRKSPGIRIFTTDFAVEPCPLPLKLT
jgi:hypothetical protein